MKLRSLALANFRKFRQPIQIAGFTDGLNILVEPNEAGKSTLLEALRAALFIRHSAKTELVRSFCPLGDDVAPRVAVTFDLGADRWQIEKQFLKAPSIVLTGRTGRLESDAAEERLQSLLGFEKGNNRGSDPESRGALGLLWVEQASALAVEAPGKLVCEQVRGALEAEVGAILGGRRFDLVRERVEEAYTALRTAKSGKPTGRFAEAEAALIAARGLRVAAEDSWRTYEQALASLEQERTRKRLIERDLDDPEQGERRRKLEDDLKVAETAQLRLSTAQAEHAAAEANVRALEQAALRFEQTEAAIASTATLLKKAKANQAEQQRLYDSSTTEEADKRRALGEARAARIAAERAVSDARELSSRRARAAALKRARAQGAQVEQLEQTLAAKATVVKDDVDDASLKMLGALDRKAIEARALRDAGAVGIEIEMLGEHPLRIDGAPADPGRFDIVRPTEISIEAIVNLKVSPPAASGRSADAAYRAATEALDDMLKTLRVDDYAAAIARNGAAKTARQDMTEMKRRIEALCPGDSSLGLEPGVAALKELLATALMAEDTPEEEPDLAGLDQALQKACEDEQRSLGQHEAAATVLHDAEKRLVQLGAEESAAANNAGAAERQLAALEAEQDRHSVTPRLQEAREEFARRVEKLEQAKRAAQSFDADRLRRSIANIDQARARASEERLGLVHRIASLEATIQSEGPKGLAGQLAEAREAEEAAVAHHARLEQEAETLALLRTVLREASEAASRTFLGPVTRRAARYVERILPGCDLLFSEAMGLSAITRDGIDEDCGDLSRGTQEQLAVLTRLGFADLLLEKGAPVSLILDDPLVYSDDSRLEMMTEILEEAAERMQIILLTCRSKAFRHVSANRILLAGQAA